MICLWTTREWDTDVGRDKQTYQFDVQTWDNSASRITAVIVILQTISDGRKWHDDGVIFSSWYDWFVKRSSFALGPGLSLLVPDSALPLCAHVWTTVESRVWSNWIQEIYCTWFRAFSFGVKKSTLNIKAQNLRRSAKRPRSRSQPHTDLTDLFKDQHGSWSSEAGQCLACYSRAVYRV